MHAPREGMWERRKGRMCDEILEGKRTRKKAGLKKRDARTDGPGCGWTESPMFLDLGQGFFGLLGWASAPAPSIACMH